MTAARIAACMLVAVALAPTASGATTAPDPRAVAASVAHELGVQDRLPSEDSSRRVSDGSSGPAASAPAPSIRPGNASVVLVWAAAIFAAIFLGVTLFDGLSDRRRRTRTAFMAEEGATSTHRARARASLSTADELAAAGRYTEAIHQLLADAVALLRRRIGAELSDALTSREIVRTVRLPEAERNALRDIVTRVEQTWFAQRLAAVDDYAAVRASFGIFTVAGSAGG